MKKIIKGISTTIFNISSLTSQRLHDEFLKTLLSHPRDLESFIEMLHFLADKRACKECGVWKRSSFKVSSEKRLPIQLGLKFKIIWRNHIEVVNEQNTKYLKT